MAYFFSMLDISILNAFLLMEANGYLHSRRHFIQKLSEQLAAEEMNVR